MHVQLHHPLSHLHSPAGCPPREATRFASEAITSLSRLLVPVKNPTDFQCWGGWRSAAVREPRVFEHALQDGASLTAALQVRCARQAASPERCFKGAVENAGDTGMLLGEQVVVSFDPGQHPLHGDQRAEHGHYNLSSNSTDRFILVSFVRKNGGTNREAEQADEDQLWGGDLFKA